MKVQVQEARTVCRPDELGNVRRDVLVRLGNESELLPGAQLHFRRQSWEREFAPGPSPRGTRTEPAPKGQRS